jgi:hypothetical protein
VTRASLALTQALLELISSESSPMADSGPDLRPDRRRLTQRGWWAPVAQCHIRGSGATGLKDKVRHCCLSYRLHCPNPSRSRGRHCRRHHCTASSSPPLDLPDLDVDAMADSNTSKSTGQLSLSLPPFTHVHDRIYVLSIK